MHLSPTLAGRTETLRAQFLTARPFKHVVIDDFFQPEFADKLLSEFPRFDKKLAKAEGGEVGGKAVNTRIAEIGPVYHDLYSEIASKPFLDFVSALSGIPELILDPAMFGGGTHENLDGQELDPHVDFNYDESERLHRRLNLIVYLNKGWQRAWGGGLEIHSNPRRPDENRIDTFDPIFNRAVMFETNEYSWHGFSKIMLPEGHKQESRKSISIYLYTKDRPAEEVAPRHATFYVQRPLPERFHPGHTLTAEDVDEMQRLLTRRDRWIEMYQQMELDMNGAAANMARQLRQVEHSARVPVTGYIRQQGPASGFYSDSWTEPVFRFRVQPVEPVSAIELNGYRPEGSQPGRISLLIDGQPLATTEVKQGPFTVAASLKNRATQPFDIEARFEGPSAPAGGGDQRNLAWLLLNVNARHAGGVGR